MSTAYDKLYNVRVRLEEGTLARLKQRCDENERSLAAEIRFILKTYLENEKWPGEDKIK